jgi:hypothetical protein
MRVLRTGLVVLVVLAVATVIADSAARRMVEGRLADGIRTSQNLPEQPSVSVGGTPFLLEALRGRYDDVQLGLGPVAVPGGPRLTSVQAQLTGVTAPLSSLNSASSSDALPDVRADAVDAQALVSYSALTTTFGGALPRQASGLTLSRAASPGALRVRLSYALLGVAIPIDAVVHLAIKGKKLVATASPPTLSGVPEQFRDQVAQLMSFTTALPALPYGLAISGLSVRADGIAFTATGHNVRLGAVAS